MSLSARLFRLFGIVSLGLALTSCFGLDSALQTGSTGAGRSALRDEPTLLVAALRRPAGDARVAPFFTADRGAGLVFASARLAPPAASSLAGSLVSGSSQWSVRTIERLATAEAGRALAAAASGRDLLLYVHGYAETFESAAAGAAGLADAIGFQGRVALFSWPSGGRLISYAYDRESALWSRDGLAEVLRAMAANPAAGKVHIIAHSMGAFLTLESLRQLGAAGGDQTLARIGAVVLASPDIDIDQFEAALKREPALASHITIISATNDRALAVSARLAGGITRVGASERDRLVALGVRVADASEFGWGVLRHDLFYSNADVRAVIARAIARAP